MTSAPQQARPISYEGELSACSLGSTLADRRRGGDARICSWVPQLVGLASLARRRGPLSILDFAERLCSDQAVPPRCRRERCSTCARPTFLHDAIQVAAKMPLARVGSI